VYEVVSSGLLSKRRLFSPLGAAGKQAIEQALEVVDMADRRKDAVAELSGGQQQRVLIARALVSDPELLILDEPTAGVDLASQQIFADAIRAKVAGGATVVMVSHDLGPMDALIDRSVVMRRGRIVYDGPPHASQTHAHVHHSHSDNGANGADGQGWTPS
jgi:zinc transport system ATP-binding protein